MSGDVRFVVLLFVALAANAFIIGGLMWLVNRAERKEGEGE